MDNLLPLATYSLVGHQLLLVLFVLSVLLGLSGALNLTRQGPVLPRTTTILFSGTALVFMVGFFWISWFHYQIYLNIALEIPAHFAEMVIPLPLSPLLIRGDDIWHLKVVSRKVDKSDKVDL